MCHMKISSNIIILGAKPIKGIRSLGAVSNINITNRRSILDIQIQNLSKRFTCDNIIYIGGYMGDRIEFNKKYSISYIHNQNYDSKNNGYSLRLTLPYLKHNTTLILFNSILFNYKIFDNIKKTKNSGIFIDNHLKNTYKVGCNIDSKNNKVNNLFYGLDNRLCGIYFLNESEHKHLKQILNNSHKTLDNSFIFEIINDIINMGGTFDPITIDHNLINQITSNSTLKKTIRYYAKNFSS